MRTERGSESHVNPLGNLGGPVIMGMTDAGALDWQLVLSSENKIFFKGEPIAVQGDLCECMFIVESGRVCVSLTPEQHEDNPDAHKLLEQPPGVRPP